MLNICNHGIIAIELLFRLMFVYVSLFIVYLLLTVFVNVKHLSFVNLMSGAFVKVLHVSRDPGSMTEEVFYVY